MAVWPDGKPVGSRTTSILSAMMKAAKFAAPSKLWMSLKDCRIPQRLPYQTRNIVSLVIAKSPLIPTLGREKWPHETLGREKWPPQTRLTISRLDEWNGCSVINREKDHGEYSDSREMGERST